jgi:hypothetical protein
LKFIPLNLTTLTNWKKKKALLIFFQSNEFELFWLLIRVLDPGFIYILQITWTQAQTHTPYQDKHSLKCISHYLRWLFICSVERIIITRAVDVEMIPSMYVSLCPMKRNASGIVDSRAFYGPATEICNLDPNSSTPKSLKR